MSEVRGLLEAAATRLEARAQVETESLDLTTGSLAGHPSPYTDYWRSKIAQDRAVAALLRAIDSDWHHTNTAAQDAAVAVARAIGGQE